jgi:hypothetical protein
LCFYLKKKAVEAQSTLTEAYGDYAPSKKGLKVVILIRKTKSVRASRKSLKMRNWRLCSMKTRVKLTKPSLGNATNYN